MKMVFLILLFTNLIFGQVNLPTIPQAQQIQNYSNQNYSNSNNGNVSPNSVHTFYKETEQERIQRQNQQIINEVNHFEKQREDKIKQAYEADDLMLIRSFNLPSFSDVKGANDYHNVYKKMLTLNVENYSTKDVNFDIENAFFENKQDKAQFDKIIKNSGDFILDKMKELKYDLNSNVAKNYMLFQFFSETLQLKSNGLKHSAFKYDFEDYMGGKNWSKMFVSKLLETKAGQCHSMPLLYLILAEQIGAEAFLSFSPSHSFIKFRDENNKWFNIELTNGMFTANYFMINSGYIKAEALQNDIYLQNLSKPQLLSEFYVDLANGYAHKFGYDDFVKEVADKALELYPKNVNAQMIVANYSIVCLRYACSKIGIDLKDKEQFQKIRNYPNVMALLNEANLQSKKVEDLGYTEMPAEAYESWLGSLKEAKHKQDNEKTREQMKSLSKGLSNYKKTQIKD